ncbi:hypothetical protein V1512DRAFT_256851 [Lipomyces arxii]|uniref:uncharacterized protein n=1 Tax=Lipomyces arxii TaxID=56418 RepID=UPI0034CEE693
MFEGLKYKLLGAVSDVEREQADAKLVLPRTKHRDSNVSLPAPPVHRIDTSFNVFKTIVRIKTHKLCATDLQYVLLFFVGVFCFFVVEIPTLIWKILLVLAIATGLLIPITSQVVLPFLPVASWLILFYSCRFIPQEWRPPIWVSVLPSLETIFYGENLSDILSADLNSTLDVLAWLPYGIMHYGAPFVVAIALFIFGSPGTLPVFARSFGYMNLTGVIIQLSFPTSPPWYENMNGLTPANYNMHGSPGGLARIDELFGLNLYTSTFNASPLVFGAFPSLHSGFSVLEACFMSHVFPRLKPLFWFYVFWIWWATMYLTHHYFIDLVGGAVLATTTYLIARWNYLPNLQQGKGTRWQYEYIELDDYDSVPRPQLNRSMTPLGLSSMNGGRRSGNGLGISDPLVESKEREIDDDEYY